MAPDLLLGSAQGLAYCPGLLGALETQLQMLRVGRRFPLQSLEKRTPPGREASGIGELPFAEFSEESYLT